MADAGRTTRRESPISSPDWTQEMTKGTSTPIPEAMHGHTLDSQAVQVMGSAVDRFCGMDASMRSIRSDVACQGTLLAPGWIDTLHLLVLAKREQYGGPMVNFLSFPVNSPLKHLR